MGLGAFRDEQNSRTQKQRRDRGHDVSGGKSRSQSREMIRSPQAM